MPLPAMPTDTGDGQPVPLDQLAQSTPSFAQGVASRLKAGMLSGLLASGTTAVEGQFMQHFAVGGDRPVPHAEAEKYFADNGLDAKVLPEGDVSVGALSAIANNQMLINRANEISRAAGTSGNDWTSARQWAGFLFGGLPGAIAGDPEFAAVGGVGGAAFKGLSLGGRLAVGAGEGALTMAGYDEAKLHLGTAPGDADIDTKQILTDTAFGGFVGGALHGAFGPRPADMSNYLDMVRGAEKTDTYAAAHNIAPSEVVSPKGAVGEYQIMPATAKQYGFDPTKLGEADYNKKVATAVLRDLHNKFGDDPEAIAVGYNAGPGVARKFVDAGYDRSILPAETRGYLQTIDQAGGRETFGLRQTPPSPSMTPEEAQGRMATAFAQDATDSEIAVAPEPREPFLPGMAPSAQELQAGYSSFADTLHATPPAIEPGSALVKDPDVAPLLARADQMPPTAEIPRPQAPNLPASPAEVEASVLAARTQAMLKNAAPPEPGALPLAESFKVLTEEEQNGAALDKAIEAAVRCGSVKGFG